MVHSTHKKCKIGDGGSYCFTNIHVVNQPKKLPRMVGILDDVATIGIVDDFTGTISLNHYKTLIDGWFNQQTFDYLFLDKHEEYHGNLGISGAVCHKNNDMLEGAGPNW